VCTKLCTKFSSGDFALADLETLGFLSKSRTPKIAFLAHSVDSGKRSPVSTGNMPLKSSSLQPVDFARYYSVLIRKPLSCVMGHDIARYSAGPVLDLFSARQMRNFINYRQLGR